MNKITELVDYADNRGNRVIGAAREARNVAVSFTGHNNTIHISPGARVAKLSVSFDCSEGHLFLGANSTVGPSRWTIRIGEEATVRIGDDVSTTDVCGVSAVEGASVTIGDDVMIAIGCQLRADDGHPIFDVRTGRRVNPAKSILIGNHVWLGYGSVALAGARIGRGTVIGFRSIVTGTIPNNCIAVGSPARVVRRDIAWERPHLSLVAPHYKPDASTVVTSPYWDVTEADGSTARRHRVLRPQDGVKSLVRLLSNALRPG